MSCECKNIVLEQVVDGKPLDAFVPGDSEFQWRCVDCNEIESAMTLALHYDINLEDYASA